MGTLCSYYHTSIFFIKVFFTGLAHDLVYFHTILYPWGVVGADGSVLEPRPATILLGGVASYCSQFPEAQGVSFHSTIPTIVICLRWYDACCLLIFLPAL